MSTVQLALPILLSALGGKLGIKLNICGERAFTDGESITIPSLPLNESPELRVLAYGYGGHEASHVKHTDMVVYRDFAKQGEFARKLLNIIEDIRIERAIMAEFPGMVKTLKSLVEYIVNNQPRAFGAPCLNDAPADILTAWLLISRRHRVLKQSALATNDAIAEDVMRKAFGDDFVDQLEAILACLPSMPFGKERTVESVKVAQAILDLIQDSQKNEPESKQEKSDKSEKSSGDNSNEDSNDDSGTDGSQKGNDDSNNQGSGSDKGKNTADQTNSQNKKQDKNLKELAKSGDDAKCFNNELASDLGDVLKDLLNKQTFSEKSVSNDAPVSELNKYDGRPEKGGSIDIARAKSLSGPLRQRLRVLVEGNARVRPRAQTVGNRLVASKLSRVAIGDYRVFSKKVDAKTTHAAVHIMVDASSSMRIGDRITEASIGALALAEAFDSMKEVNLGVSSFGGVDFSYRIHHGKRLTNKSRQNMAILPGGSTPLDKALITVSGILLSQPEERKVVLILTDGEPTKKEASINMINSLKSAGVIVLGIGIAIRPESKEVMSKLFNDGYEQVTTADEIREAMYRMVLRII